MKKVISPSLETKGSDSSISQDTKDNTESSSRKRQSKLMTLLIYFSEGKSLNRFEAEKIGCHCLNTSVNDIRRKWGIRLARKWEEVPTRFGAKVRCCRYWLDLQDYAYVAEILTKAA